MKKHGSTMTVGLRKLGTRVAIAFLTVPWGDTGRAGLLVVQNRRIECLKTVPGVGFMRAIALGETTMRRSTRKLNS